MIDDLKTSLRGGLRMIMARQGVFRQSHPRIKKVESGDFRCFSTVGLYPVYGHGKSPKESYENWLSDMKRYAPEVAKEAEGIQK